MHAVCQSAWVGWSQMLINDITFLYSHGTSVSNLLTSKEGLDCAIPFRVRSKHSRNLEGDRLLCNDYAGIYIINRFGATAIYQKSQPVGWFASQYCFSILLYLFVFAEVEQNRKQEIC